jgi:exodeoxyribonuclease VII large subunit
MTRRLPLSVLLLLVQDTIEARFEQQVFWITAEVTDVKKFESKRWCFLKFVEKQKDQLVAEMPGVFWANGYQQIVQFERITRQSFRNGIEVSCLVAVKFHARYGLKLEVLEIDTSFALGQIELQRRQTMQRLLDENPAVIQQIDDQWFTINNQLALPKVLQRVALITAPNSDGQRDFKKELTGNNYGYWFKITEFTCTLQGNTAAAQLLVQLQHIFDAAPQFDVVAIVRGGGSETDFTAFDDYELCKRIAAFPIPVFTGIGHDRNTSIADLMATQHKTPTKVAGALVDHNYRFEWQMLQWQQQIAEAAAQACQTKSQQLALWQQRLMHTATRQLATRQKRLQSTKQQLTLLTKWQLQNAGSRLQHQKQFVNHRAGTIVQQANQKLDHATRLLHQLNPETILSKGFAMVTVDRRIVTNPHELAAGQLITTILKQTEIESVITQKSKHENTHF